MFLIRYLEIEHCCYEISPRYCKLKESRLLYNLVIIYIHCLDIWIHLDIYGTEISLNEKKNTKTSKITNVGIIIIITRWYP